MATNVTVPATFEYTAGSLRTTRVVPARFAYTASSTLISSKDTSTTTAAAIPELDRLTSFEKLLNPDGTPTQRFMGLIQSYAEQIESAFEAVNARVDEVAILARLNAVETLAQVANDNAVAATATATAVAAATQETFADIDPVYRDQFESRFEIP